MIRKLIAMVGCLLVAAVAAAPAGADSLAFVRDNNVWLAHPDGSGQYQVTFDGTAAAPYESPSQSDSGTVVATRQTLGQRRQIYRMTQSGGLLNPPINTPAPGTGALAGKVSPDGALVAYWFATTVNDPICVFCVSVSNQVLLSHSERFSGYQEVGTPNTGGWPSWIDSSTITLGSGSGTQWYYKLGMPEAAEWFADSDVIPQGLEALLDAEAAPTGDRLAVVRGENQGTILLLRMNGPPPAKPTVANPQCDPLSHQPDGKFVDPTWSSDGRTLAWQEDNGVWTLPVPADLADCAGFGAPALRIPGAKNPDLSLAPINPGLRPPCGNPGNPAACISPPPPPPPPPPCGDPGNPCQVQPPPAIVVRKSLSAFANSVSRVFARIKMGALLRKRQVTIGFTAPAAGMLTASSTSPGRTTVIATGRRVYTAAGTAKVTIKLTPQGTKRLRMARAVRGTLRASFAPRGGRAIATTSTVPAEPMTRARRQWRGGEMIGTRVGSPTPVITELPFNRILEAVEGRGRAGAIGEPRPGGAL